MGALVATISMALTCQVEEPSTASLPARRSSGIKPLAAGAAASGDLVAAAYPAEADKRWRGQQERASQGQNLPISAMLLDHQQRPRGDAAEIASAAHPRPRSSNANGLCWRFW